MQEDRVQTLPNLSYDYHYNKQTLLYQIQDIKMAWFLILDLDI